MHPGLNASMKTLVAPSDADAAPSVLPPARGQSRLPDVPRAASKARYPAFELGPDGTLSDTEVHLRRLDDDDFLHLRIVATIRCGNDAAELVVPALWCPLCRCA